MRDFCFFCICIFLSIGLYSQDSQGDSLVVDVDILKALQSPAANLLGISNSDIARPSDPTAIMTSLQQATSNFSELPANYAIDLAPAWLFGYKHIKADDFLSNKVRYNIPQSFIVSTAVNNNDVIGDSASLIQNTAIGIGVKFSILRGKIAASEQSKLDDIRNDLVDFSKGVSELIDEKIKNSVKYQDAQKIVFNDKSTGDERTAAAESMQEEQSRILNEVLAVNNLQEERVKLNQQDVDLTRYGFKVDFNAALAFDFPNRVYDNSRLSKAAAWLTVANEWESGLSLLGIARFIRNPDALFADEFGVVNSDDLSIFDFGLKILYARDKFVFSFEGIGQSVSGDSSIESGTKYLINSEYTLSKNMRLSLTFGKDFNNMITKQGNVISTLNFLMGFGSKRKVS